MLVHGDFCQMIVIRCGRPRPENSGFSKEKLIAISHIYLPIMHQTVVNEDYAHESRNLLPSPIDQIPYVRTKRLPTIIETPSRKIEK